MEDRFQKIATVTLISLAIFTVVSMAGLEEYFYRTRPRSPDIKIGRTYPQDVKSIQGVAKVYLTQTESIPFRCFYYFTPILCVSGVVIAFIIVWKKRTKA